MHELQYKENVERGSWEHLGQLGKQASTQARITRASEGSRRSGFTATEFVQSVLRPAVQRK